MKHGASTNREKRVVAILHEAAEHGLPCPSNGEIVDTGIANSADQVYRAIVALRDEGRIAVESSGGFRIVTILASGKRTGRQVKRPPIYVKTPKDAPVAFTPVDRDPCSYCGIRGDVGCRHRPRQDHPHQRAEAVKTPVHIGGNA